MKRILGQIKMVPVIYIEGLFQEPTVFEFPLPYVQQLKEDEKALDYIFRQCNAVDGTEWICNQKLRSMCVGDMIKIDGDLWIVMGSGWKKV